VACRPGKGKGRKDCHLTERDAQKTKTEKEKMKKIERWGSTEKSRKRCAPKGKGDFAGAPRRRKEKERPENEQRGPRSLSPKKGWTVN